MAPVWRPLILKLLFLFSKFIFSLQTILAALTTPACYIWTSILPSITFTTSTYQIRTAASLAFSVSAIPTKLFTSPTFASLGLLPLIIQRPDRTGKDTVTRCSHSTLEHNITSLDPVIFWATNDLFALRTKERCELQSPFYMRLTVNRKKSKCAPFVAL